MTLKMCAFAGGVCLAAIAAGQTTVVSFSPSRWGLTGESIGARGMTVENFEDVQLAAGLRVSVNTGSGAYGPTTTLPAVFNPSVNDSFGTAFVGGVYDGTNCLVNTHVNAALPYANGANWGDVTLHFDPPVREIGFSLHQSELSITLRVNGAAVGSLQSLGGAFPNGGAVGYFLVRSTEPMHTITLDNTGGDGWTIDHLVFTTEPVPPITVQGFNVWGVSDAELGIAEPVVEDFEDVQLVEGLRVGIESPLGALALTDTLPATFNPVTQDPFGNAFVNGVWDGSRVLLNTRTNTSFPYSETGHWGDVLLEFSPARYTVGFAVGDLNQEGFLFVNGRFISRLRTPQNLPLGPRQGYVRLFGPCNLPAIADIRIANGRQTFGDGIVLDHLTWGTCRADFNCDDAVDDLDISAFFLAFEAGESTADVNGDDGIDDLDITAYFTRFESGC